MTLSSVGSDIPQRGRTGPLPSALPPHTLAPAPPSSLVVVRLPRCSVTVDYSCWVTTRAHVVKSWLILCWTVLHTDEAFLSCSVSFTSTGNTQAMC